MTNATSTQKLLSYIGFAAKARKLVCGTGPCEIALKKGSAKAVLLSGDTQKNTAKHFSDMASYRNVPCYFLDCTDLGKAAGAEDKKVICITDKGFADAVIKEINLSLGGK